MGESIDATKEKLASLDDVISVKINSSDIDQATENMNSFTATVTTATGQVEKLKYELANGMNGDTSLYSQTGVKSQSDNSQSEQITQENALVERENDLRDQTLSLMTQINDLEGEIVQTEQKGNAPLVDDITLRKEALELQLQQVDSNSIASDEAFNAILEQQKACQEDISTILAKIQGQNDAIGESIDAQTIKFQALKASELQAFLYERFTLHRFMVSR